LDLIFLRERCMGVYSPPLQRPVFTDLSDASDWFRSWLTTAALPLWWTLGADHARGGFREALTTAGELQDMPRRARVQARQAYVYAVAGEMGWPGPWRQAAWHGLSYLQDRYDQPDGCVCALVTEEGRPLDEQGTLYDLAFVLLATATLYGCEVQDQLLEDAQRRRAALIARRHDAGGYREVGAHPFQSNAQMHLLEAALAWEAVGGEGWGEIADEIVVLALERFIDPKGGFLREVFDDHWAPAPGFDGAFHEPGHQFEWAWLLSRWGRARRNNAALAAASRLFEIGSEGVDEVRDVAVNQIWNNRTVRDATARLWPQTERLKAALTLGRCDHALRAAQSLAAYLDTPARGVWRDKLRPDGSFVDEPAPASTFYHIVAACRELFAEANTLH
jgi:mannose-1-phosphate guanylyltransferase/mannose-6-phosphate isomerase